MQHIAERLKTVMEKSRATERGDLMHYFRQRLNAARGPEGFPLITMSRMGKILEKIPTKDLYYLKSVCDRAAHFSKRFWWEIDPKKHTPEAKQELNRGKIRSYAK